MADLFNKLNILGRAIINDAAGNLLNGGNDAANKPNNSADNSATPPPEESARSESPDTGAKQPSEAGRAAAQSAARTDERLDSAIGLLQQHFLKVTTEMAELDKQIDAALLDGDDDVARQLTHRLQQQQQQAQQIADDMVRYNIPLPVPPPEPATNPPMNTAPGSVTIPVNNPSGSIRVPVRTGDSVNAPAISSTTQAQKIPLNSPVKPQARPASDLLSDRPAAPESDAKLAERRRRLSAPDDNNQKK